MKIRELNLVYFSLASAMMAFLTSSCVNDNLADLSKKMHTDTTQAATTSTSTTTTPTTTGSTNTTTSTTTTPAVTVVSFSKNIQPILFKYNCSGCHGNAYYNYGGVSSLARSGQLYGTMAWKSGYRKMPPSGRALDAELALISAWISQGTLNN